jgi:hypothetical protein
VVAIDGKSLRRGYEAGRAFMPPLMVNVFDAETRLTLAVAHGVQARLALHFDATGPTAAVDDSCHDFPPGRGGGLKLHGAPTSSDLLE